MSAQEARDATPRAAEIDPFSKFLAIKLIEFPGYAPYCMRCFGFHRMKSVEFGYWRHHCGAIADHRADLALLARTDTREPT